MRKPECFVVMPFGKKRDLMGLEFNFDSIYKELIEPAVRAADMEPIRADMEKIGGVIHKPMFERLILSEYVLADLTTANANVFYELGIRHATKPYTTVSIFSGGSSLPFDVNFLRSIPYSLDPETGQFTRLEYDIGVLSNKLTHTKTEKSTDSPVFQLIDGLQFQNSVAHQKTDIFRERVEYEAVEKDKLARIRESGKAGLESLNVYCANLRMENTEAGILIDVMLSYRALEAYREMIEFIGELPRHVRESVMVQEQLGFALNRVKQRKEAEDVLLSVVEKHGPSSETYGILGRVYKDYMSDYEANGNLFMAESFLDKAIEAYRMGLEADMRDAYPGVNLYSLLVKKGELELARSISSVVEFAVLQKIKHGKTKADYWDYATLLELSVLTKDLNQCQEYLKKMLALPSESWMIQTTLNNLEIIQTSTLGGQYNPEVLSEVIKLLKIHKSDATNKNILIQPIQK